MSYAEMSVNTLGQTAPMLDVALACIARGWHVFPCWPKTKKPMTRHGKNDAALDEFQVTAWWTQTPDANVAISCGPSNLCVVDIDHGLKDVEDLGLFFESVDDLGSFLAPPGGTYIVRTGRRPEYGAQVYYQGAVPDVGIWKSHGCEGQVKSLGGYVMAAGSIHPDTGLAYEVLNDGRLLDTPDWVRSLKPEKTATVDDDSPITANRNNTLTSIAGKMRNAGMPGDELEDYLQRQNLKRCQPPLDESEVRRIAENIGKYSPPDDGPEVVIGSAKPKEDRPTDWHELFHTRADVEGAPDPVFLIDRFLQEESITGLIGPARARKSIVTVNIIRSLLTGEALFGKLEVSNKPERCLYLCPESGLLSTAKRLRNMGLAEFIGTTLFFTSMNSKRVALLDPLLMEAAKGAVVFIDTAIRFFKGDENSAADMKVFADSCQTLIQSGARAIVLLHHTKKGMEGLTLEGGRGSGDFGGFLTCCWGTTLDDYENAYSSPSLMKPVKERDFRAESFSLAPSGDDDNFFLQYIDGSENTKAQVGAKEKAGKAKAMAFVRAHTDWTAERLSDELAEQGIVYSQSACQKMLRAARRPGVSITQS